MNARKIVAVAGAVVALGLTGCETPDVEEGHVTFEEVSLPDGRTVDCVRWGQGYQAGLSCDWENAR